MRGMQPRPFSGAKALKRCQNNGEFENVVLIDVDSYNLVDNVIVIDVPENPTKKQRGKRLKNDKNRSLRTYIYIDDEESPENHQSGVGVGDSKFDSGASSSRRNDSDSQFAQDNVSPVKLSKGKRTYSGRTFNNRNGFSTQSDSDSSGDCEFMEDSSGKLREQWEMASLKRRDHCSSCRDAHNGIRVNKHKQNCEEVPNKRKSKEVSYEKESRSPVGCSKSNLSVDETSPCQSQHSDENDRCQFISGHRYEKHEHTTCASSREENEENDISNSAHNDADPVDSSIINLREKLKETDEYKRALEEEWLARERALKIQAEEAQQLRRLQKRKKAESLRLLDMERRQKQRVEEIRETQKKDEENMNLKELYRTRVRKELDMLEVTCHDMASLLRGLGIQVGDGPFPLSHEVRAAYKRALLSFHPDRFSGSDLRQQVEAEEKFKLISRMKDKLLL